MGERESRQSNGKRVTMQNKLLSLDSVCAILGGGSSFSKQTLYRWVRSGYFPPPVKLGRGSRWVSSEVGTVVDARIAGKSDDDVRRIVAAIVIARAGANPETQATAA